MEAGKATDKVYSHGFGFGSDFGKKGVYKHCMQLHMYAITSHNSAQLHTLGKQYKVY